jgi:hypothetical protein
MRSDASCASEISTHPKEPAKFQNTSKRVSVGKGYWSFFARIVRAAGRWGRGTCHRALDLGHLGCHRVGSRPGLTLKLGPESESKREGDSEKGDKELSRHFHQWHTTQLCLWPPEEMNEGSGAEGVEVVFNPFTS